MVGTGSFVSVLTLVRGLARVGILKMHSQLAIVGGGPAGLRAAEVAAMGGLEVTVYEGKRSVGRKLLVAGKGGLNLTHGEDFESFLSRYDTPECDAGSWREILANFDSPALRNWASELGVETFQATSGRVYPKALKAAPLLRRWLERLRALGVKFEMNHRCVSVEQEGNYRLGFADGRVATAEAVIFALGGGSWGKTGSDGRWCEMFGKLGIFVNPLAPANCGWECEWPPEILEAAEGFPLKNLEIRANGVTAIGELMLTHYGLEGGAIYQLGATLRAMDEPEITIDFKPTFSVPQLVTKMESVKRNFLSEAKVRWRLSEAAFAILGRKPWEDAISLAVETKHCAIPLSGPRPLDEAISSAGGVCWRELDENLMLKSFPGIYVAGEMIDWEAPTGGYLLQGCFASGTRAGQAAAARLMGVGPMEFE